MKRHLFLSLAIALLLPGGAEAQEGKWSLRNCLDYALEHNIQLKKSRINKLFAEEDTRQAKAQLFPSLSASVGQSLTGNGLNSSAYSGSYSLSANWTVFDASRRTNTIRQQELQNEISELSVQQDEREICISLVQTYMQTLYAYEAVRINENTVEVSKAQRDRAGALLKAGSISHVSFAQLESQYSADKYQLVVARKNLDNYKLQLKQLLELDITEEIELGLPSLTEADIMLPLPGKEVIYAAALAFMPEVKSSELNIGIAELETKKAAAGYYPSLSMNAGMGTANSSDANLGLGGQLRDRFNENVGLTLNIPILSNRANKTAVNKARFSLTNNRLELLNTQKNLLRSLEGVYLDATSAQDQYMASVERLKYIAESYRLTEEQFFLGMKNTFELLTEKNNMLNAQQEELQSKYMAVLSILLLNIYQGKPINENY